MKAFFTLRRFKMALLLAVACLLPHWPAEAFGQAEELAGAINSFETLCVDKKKGMQREPWEKLAADFARIRNMRGGYAAEAFFYQARSREELADRSRKNADHSEAARLYAAVAAAYPRHGLADNALYNQAMLLSGPLGNKAGALKVLDYLALRYPDGDMYGDALLLRERLGGKPLAARPVARPAPGASPGPPAASRPAAASPAPATPAIDPVSVTTATPAAPLIGEAENQKQRELYNRAAGTWRRLVAGADPQAARRETWEALEQEFGLALKAAPKGPLADKAAFQAARSREELAKRSKRAQDWQAAARLFDEAAGNYPASSLADDALYARALILADQLNWPAEARQAAQSLLERYPNGDMLDKAAALLKRLAAAQPAPAPALAPPAPLPAPPAPAPVPGGGNRDNLQPPRGGTGNIKAQAPATGALLRHLSWESGRDAFILNISLAGKAKYQRRHLAPDKPGRGAGSIQLDLFYTDLHPDLLKSLRFSGAPVEAVRLSRLKNGSARLELELNEAASYKVNVLQNPYRLQIEVSGNKMLPQGHSLRGAASGGAGGNLVEQLGLSVKTVVVDAGHGGSDPGALGNGIKESACALEIAKLLGQRLEKEGFKVIYTRESDKKLSLEERTTLANERKADLFISIHINSNASKSVSGLETYYLDVARSDAAALVAARENAVDVKDTSDLQFILSDLTRNSKRDESRELAGMVLQSTVNRLQQSGFSVKSNGVRSAPFFVLLGARMPAFLVEAGYLSNAKDAESLKNRKYREKLADGIAEGLIAYRKKINSLAP
ncbi:MAG: N-acetylmuramoyl-L-alanine amidase [Deltaproteobacteria bacterium]|jgi:N-acetylmuramoyl-L-alanine amidase|nr:N-acetylmuramoyl-L-alanine amidase [Deltaproteobacteria bacterium]